jgi:glycine/D-amino acid oxidase-like deaminating enzyme
VTADPAAYAAVSHWLADAGDLTPRAPLDGPADADVAILGAGFTGLWTARELLRRDPSLRVVVLEAEIAGYGASGRNGAWCVAGVGMTAGELARRHGAGAARRVVTELRDTVDEVGRAAAEEGIDAGFARTGVLRVARGRHEVPGVRAALATWDRLGLADGMALLDRDELAARVRVGRGELALFDPHGAVLHPGRLVRGLARAVEARGAVIHERTPVTAVVGRRGRARPRLRTVRGDVTADTVVIAGEAWLARLPGWRRRVLPVYSLIVLTEPIGEDRWAEVGWAGRELLSSSRYTVDYLSRTADGRILFGGRGAPYHFGSRIEPAYDRHGATHATLRAQFADWFPALRGVRFTAAWGGPVGMPRTWLPSFTADPRTGIAAAYGYTGQGVAAANLAGRVLADLLTGTGERWADLPMVGRTPRRWEPEPVRWLAVRALQRALQRLDDHGLATGRPPTGRSLAERLTRH